MPTHLRINFSVRSAVGFLHTQLFSLPVSDSTGRHAACGCQRLQRPQLGCLHLPCPRREHTLRTFDHVYVSFAPSQQEEAPLYSRSYSIIVWMKLSWCTSAFIRCVATLDRYSSVGKRQEPCVQPDRKRTHGYVSVLLKRPTRSHKRTNCCAAQKRRPGTSPRCLPCVKSTGMHHLTAVSWNTSQVLSLISRISWME